MSEPGSPPLATEWLPMRLLGNGTGQAAIQARATADPLQRARVWVVLWVIGDPAFRWVTPYQGSCN